MQPAADACPGSRHSLSHNEPPLLTTDVRDDEAAGYRPLTAIPRLGQRRVRRGAARRLLQPGLALALLLDAGPALAQSHSPGGTPPPTGMSLQRSTAMRFPQPVRVGSLIGEDVQEPLESHVVLGHVRSLVRAPDGRTLVVVAYGGWFWAELGSRSIAVPLDAMVVVGRVMEIVAYEPAALRRFPTFSPAGTTTLPADAMVEVGLAKPSH